VGGGDEAEKGPQGEAEETLVARIEGIAEARWKAFSGGLGGEGSADQRTEDRLQAAARLLATTFLSERGSSDREALREAVALAADPGSPKEFRLLAAACLERIGMSEDAHRIVGEVGAPTRGATAGVGGLAAQRGVFRLERVAFATRIEGPGQFRAAEEEDLKPGSTIYLYGEFRDAATALQDGDTPSYRRHFSADLTLLDADQRVVESIEFLPREQGAHVSRHPDDLVNFWARLRIPDDPSAGPYRVIVHAKDVLAGICAQEEIQFGDGQRRAHSAR
jgi:hypothetical protein